MRIRERGSRQFNEVLIQASAQAIHVAATWLYEAVMQPLISEPCDGYHADEGDPPQMESGEGFRSFKLALLSNGAEMGVGDIGTQSMIAGNYMAGWDSEHGIKGFHHPWLSTWKRYEPQLAAIIRREMKLLTGAK